MLGTGPIVKEALNKHIIKMKVGGCPWGSLASLFSQQTTVREEYWLPWIKAVHKCQQQQHGRSSINAALSERQLSVFPEHVITLSLDLGLLSPSIGASLCKTRYPAYHLGFLLRFLKHLTLKCPERVGVPFLVTLQWAIVLLIAGTEHSKSSVRKEGFVLAPVWR